MKERRETRGIGGGRGVLSRIPGETVARYFFPKFPDGSNHCRLGRPIKGPFRPLPGPWYFQITSSAVWDPPLVL